MRHLWERGSYWCYCNHHTSTNFKGLSDVMSKVRARESVGAPTSSKNKERKPPPPSPNTTSCCYTLSEAKKFFSQHQALHEDAFSRSSSKCRQLMKWRIIRVGNNLGDNKAYPVFQPFEWVLIVLVLFVGENESQILSPSHPLLQSLLLCLNSN